MKVTCSTFVYLPHQHEKTNLNGMTQMEYEISLTNQWCGVHNRSTFNTNQSEFSTTLQKSSLRNLSQGQWAIERTAHLLRCELRRKRGEL